MDTLERQLEEHHSKIEIIPKEDKIKFTIQQAERAFYNSAEERGSTYFEFIYHQGNYIQKRWWLIQFLILAAAWMILSLTETGYLVQRSMGVLAPAFVILIVPELWKNRNTGSMEIEGAAFYSIRQIYAARMMIFAFVDGILLSIFWIAVLFTTTIKIDEILIQFFLPMIVTCCICFRSLYSKYLASEYAAVCLALLWTAIWVLLILNDSVYTVISMPVWIGIICCTILYLCYTVKKSLKKCVNYWEVTIS